MSQDSTGKKFALQIVPRSPLLQSQTFSDIFRVEHHYQPANRESECCLAEGNSWLFQAYKSETEKITFASIDVEMMVEDIYENVNFNLADQG